MRNRIHVYEIYGGLGAMVFPIDIIEAATSRLAIGIVAGKSACLKKWCRRFKLYEVPYRRETSRPWRDDELQFICDIDLGASA